MTHEEQMDRIDRVESECYEKLSEQLINPHGKYRAWSVERDDSACEISDKRIAYQVVLYLIRTNPYRKIAERKISLEMPVNHLVDLNDQMQEFERWIRQGFDDWAETAKYQLRYA